MASWSGSLNPNECCGEASTLPSGAIRHRQPGLHGAHIAAPCLGEADTLIASQGLPARHPVRTLDDLPGHTLLATETRPGDWTDRAGFSTITS